MSFDYLIVVNFYPQYMGNLCLVIIQFGSLQDDILVPAINPQVPLELSRLTASSSLYHRKGRRVINADLHISACPPWSGSRREWLKK